MPTPTVENYLKQIRLDATRSGAAAGTLCPMGRLAAAVGVTPGTATTMAKSMAADGLIEYRPRGGVRLTSRGGKVADRMLRRHRLIELFLVETLGMDWADVHVEAEELEHAVSEKVLALIDAKLGHPAADPHGSPIPRAAGARVGAAGPDPAFSDLASCPRGVRLEVARIVDHDAAFLRYLRRRGLVPGAAVTVCGDPTRGAVEVAVGDATVRLGRPSARRVRVRRASGQADPGESR